MGIAAFIGLVSAAQVEGDSTPVPAYYTPFDHEATYYERVTTPRFSADTDDIFMRSMIEAYALEERTKVTEHSDGLKTGGEPSGKFWMNQASALAASKEVLATHKGLAGKMLDVHRHLLRQGLGTFRCQPDWFHRGHQDATV